jgi:hypothetical protein
MHYINKWLTLDSILIITAWLSDCRCRKWHKQSGTDDKGQTSSLGVGTGANNCTPQKLAPYAIWLQIWINSLTQRVWRKFIPQFKILMVVKAWMLVFQVVTLFVIVGIWVRSMFLENTGIYMQVHTELQPSTPVFPEVRYTEKFFNKHTIENTVLKIVPDFYLLSYELLI